jgi:ABC-type transport system involved in cytochrome c biogenesis permease subunit
MSAGSLPLDRGIGVDVARPRSRAGTRDSLAWQALRALGSLKITVVMFLAAVFLLFIGTLVQDEKNLPDVKAEYFNSWIAIIRLADFLPVTIFQDEGWRRIPGWFPFPGGGTIGLVLLVNLIAAKITRFHVAASGARLAWGSGVSILGGLLTLAVILTGHAGDGLQGQPPVSYATVWRLVQGGALALAVGLGWAAADKGQRQLVRSVLGITAAAVAGVALATIVGGAAWRMNDPGLRIMWQLIQSSAAALTLLVGLVLVFGNRGGNVLIHVAVGLLMLGQFAFGDRQIEERMSLVEGQTTNVACRTDEVELAVIDTGGSETDSVTAISGRLLAARAGGAPVSVDGLPFAIRVVEYFPNSTILRVGPVAPNRATTGLGRSWLADRRPPEGGGSSQPNVASAYVQLVAKEGEADLGTFLVSQWLNDFSQLNLTTAADECDSLAAAGTTWRLQLRFRREYKPYSVSLTDVRRINYSASETPRDYSSYVTFTDTATKAEQQGRIWMNNPVRYRGETFYQSQYAMVPVGKEGRVEMTGLQVVTNAGWLIPYVACVLAFWGMLVHFGGTFLRFADRRERQPAAAAAPGPRRGRNGQRAAPAPRAVPQPGRGLLPAALALGLIGACVLAALPRGPRPGAADWRAAGSLPVMDAGRIKPLDSVARTTLQLLGNRTAVKMPADAPAGGPTGTVSATQWLLGLMAGSDWVERAPVFRIDAKEILDLFDLERRQGHRYAPAELEKGRAKLREQVATLRDVPAESRSFVQKKMIEIEQKFAAYDVIRFAYEAPALPDLDAGADRQQAIGEIRQMMQRARLIEDRKPPALIPPVAQPPAEEGSAATNAPDWQSLYPAVMEAFTRRLTGNPGTISPAILPLSDLLAAQAAGPAEIDRAVTAYRQAIADLEPVRTGARMAAFEAWFLAFNPTDLAKWLYVFALVVCFASFLVGHAPLNRFAFWLLAGLFCLHTFAIVCRIAITGRPPVVNLYGSAVFIGWACVLAGLVLERLFRLGIGNLVAAASGALSLMIAYGLDSGDTMHVLQAVLDTQFWLSTHVVTVALGYGATFLAGLLATCSIVHGIATRQRSSDPALAREVADVLHRMTYGVVCFALFFSFIGTVLGGLWADDSWGRFWGWDPKENGALMIVLWNAALLHARWDRWIGPRGFALFAIGGNIVTAWSWFGTNQLSIGLHSYGFTSGVLMLLGAYVLSQLALIVAGLVLTRSQAAPAGAG